MAEKIGLKYKVGKHLFDSYSDFAGSDENRLADFNSMWADPDVKAVMPMRGGNGAARLLAGIDSRHDRQKSKIIVGYSDITSSGRHSSKNRTRDLPRANDGRFF